MYPHHLKGRIFAGRMNQNPDPNHSSRFTTMTISPNKISGAEALGNLGERGYRRVYHFHIRKTAGTSLNAAFWGLAGLELASIGQHREVTRDGFTFVRHDARAITDGNYFFANSHHPYQELIIPPETCTITVIRSPQERLLSFYRYLWWVFNDPEARTREVYWQAIRQKSAWFDSSFDKFLDQIPRSDLMPQLYMFSENYVIDEALDRALQCSAILFTDQFGDGIRQLTHRLGLPLQEKHERRFGQGFQLQLTYSEQNRLNNLLEDETTFVNQLRDHRHDVFKPQGNSD